MMFNQGKYNNQLHFKLVMEWNWTVFKQAACSQATVHNTWETLLDCSMLGLTQVELLSLIMFAYEWFQGHETQSLN